VMDEVLEAARRRLMCFSSGLFAPSGRKWRPECWSCGGFRYSVRSRGERHARLSRAGLGLVKRVPTGCQEKNRKGEPGEEGGRIRWESKGKDKMGKGSRRAYKKGMGPGKRNGHDLFFFPCLPPAPRTLVLASSPQERYLAAMYLTPGLAPFRSLAAWGVPFAKSSNSKLPPFLAVLTAGALPIQGPADGLGGFTRTGVRLLVPQRTLVRGSWVSVPACPSASASQLRDDQMM
jgi:hypothetical protein